jgi:hypothetical protein
MDGRRNSDSSNSNYNHEGSPSPHEEFSCDEIDFPPLTSPLSPSVNEPGNVASTEKYAPPLHASESQPSSKWCRFFTPNFAKLDVINALGNIVYGLNGSAAAGHLASAASFTASLGATFPFFGIAAGVIDLLNYGQQYWNGGYDNEYGEHTKFGNFLFALRTLSSLFLTRVGIKEATHFHTFALGVPGCGLLFTAFAIKASLDVGWGLILLASYKNDISKAKQNQQTHLNLLIFENGKWISKNMPIADARKVFFQQCADLLTKTLSLIGWICLAAGHPLGWVFLAATALPCGYQVYSACRGNKAQAEENNRASNFPHTQGPIHKGKVKTGETLFYSNTLG